VRILVVGAGVIGSVYAGKLLTAGHEVVLLARGRRLADLQASGLILEEAQSGKRTALPVTAVAALDSADRYDLVLVPVRSEQLTSTLPVLSSMRDGSDVLFFGNTAGRQAQLVEALGSRVLFGFPAAGGTREGSVVRYVLISQQQTMLGEPMARATNGRVAIPAETSSAAWTRSRPRAVAAVISRAMGSSVVTVMRVSHAATGNTATAVTP